MVERRLNTHARTALALAGLAWLSNHTQARAQTSYVAPDGHNRFPAVTIFCPSGTGVAPCNFGSGGSAAGLMVGGQAVSATNKLPVVDSALDNLITAGALPVSGAVTLNGTPTVSLGAGSSVNIGNFPATQPVSQSGGWTVGLAAGGNAIGSVSVSNFPATQPVSGAVTVSSLPALPAGANAIGSVTVSNFPASQPISGAVAQSGSWTVGLGAGSSAIGSVIVSNFPATQPVSAASLPLPAGAATNAAETAPLAPVAPAAATATNSTLIGCLANTSLPGFTAGQQGALPCDTSGRLYVDIGANALGNLPTYLTAQASGGAVTATVLNAAASTISTSIKATAGQIYVLDCSNSNSTGVWVRIYTSATAVVSGTGTPVWRSYCPAGGKTWAFDMGLVVGTGIALTVTGGAGDTDATVISTAGSVALNVGYK